MKIFSIQENQIQESHLQIVILKSKTDQHREGHVHLRKSEVMKINTFSPPLFDIGRKRHCAKGQVNLTENHALQYRNKSLWECHIWLIILSVAEILSKVILQMNFNEYL